MAELLTHVLVAFVVATILSWRYEAITQPLITAAMTGALLPDLRKIALVVPDGTVETALGIPFSWRPLHRLGGILIVICVLALLVARSHRRLVALMLSLGVFSHVFLDTFLYQPDGLAFDLLWPASSYRFPIAGWYKSFDVWPLVVLVPIVVGVVAWSQVGRPVASDDSADHATPRRAEPRPIEDGGSTPKSEPSGRSSD